MNNATLSATQEKEWSRLAVALPARIQQEIFNRAVEAVRSAEPHKITSGWVINPYLGRFSAFGLLYLASKAISEAQLRCAGYIADETAAQYR